MNWADRGIAFLIDRVQGFPLEITRGSSKRIIRLLGFLVFIVWAPVSFAILAIPVLFLLFAANLIDIWERQQL